MHTVFWLGWVVVKWHPGDLALRGLLKWSFDAMQCSDSLNIVNAYRARGSSALRLMLTGLLASAIPAGCIVEKNPDFDERNERHRHSSDDGNAGGESESGGESLVDNEDNFAVTPATQTPEMIQLRLGDVDGDGNVDLVATISERGGEVLLLGDGRGQFRPGDDRVDPGKERNEPHRNVELNPPAVSYRSVVIVPTVRDDGWAPLESDVTALVVSDVDQDGRPDVITAMGPTDSEEAAALYVSLVRD